VGAGILSIIGRGVTTIIISIIAYDININGCEIMVDLGD